jgi:hypothetical protein
MSVAHFINVMKYEVSYELVTNISMDSSYQLLLPTLILSFALS